MDINDFSHSYKDIIHRLKILLSTVNIDDQSDTNISIESKTKNERRKETQLMLKNDININKEMSKMMYYNIKQNYDDKRHIKIKINNFKILNDDMVPYNPSFMSLALNLKDLGHIEQKINDINSDESKTNKEKQDLLELLFTNKKKISLEYETTNTCFSPICLVKNSNIKQQKKSILKNKSDFNTFMLTETQAYFQNEKSYKTVGINTKKFRYQGSVSSVNTEDLSDVKYPYEASINSLPMDLNATLLKYTVSLEVVSTTKISSEQQIMIYDPSSSSLPKKNVNEDKLKIDLKQSTSITNKLTIKEDEGKSSSKKSLKKKSKDKSSSKILIESEDSSQNQKSIKFPEDEEDIQDKLHETVDDSSNSTKNENLSRKSSSESLKNEEETRKSKSTEDEFENIRKLIKAIEEIEPSTSLGEVPRDSSTEPTKNKEKPKKSIKKIEEKDSRGLSSEEESSSARKSSVKHSKNKEKFKKSVKSVEEQSVEEEPNLSLEKDSRRLSSEEELSSARKSSVKHTKNKEKFKKSVKSVEEQSEKDFVQEESLQKLTKNEENPRKSEDQFNSSPKLIDGEENGKKRSEQNVDSKESKKSKKVWALAHIEIDEDGPKLVQILQTTPNKPGHYLIKDNEIILFQNKPSCSCHKK